VTDADRQEWLRAVDAVRLQLQGVQSPLYLAPKVFKTGSVGWYYSGKAVLGDSPCQVNLCITVIGTKGVVDGTTAKDPGVTTPEGGPPDANGKPDASPGTAPGGPRKRSKAPKAPEAT